MQPQTQTMSRRLYAIAALSLAVVIFVALNIAADAWITTAKLDLTQNGQFTLADGTRDILAKIPEPITLKFYYSKKVAADYAQTQAYATRVHDLLEEYAALSNGKIVLQDIDRALHRGGRRSDRQRPHRRADRFRRHGLFRLVGTNRIDGRRRSISRPTANSTSNSICRR